MNAERSKRQPFVVPPLGGLLLPVALLEDVRKDQGRATSEREEQIPLDNPYAVAR
jgi:hypothetical protein